MNRDFLTLPLLLFALATLGPTTATLRAETNLVEVSFSDRIGQMKINQMALGQGGLSAEPMWDDRIAEVRALKPKIIRLFVQEFFKLLPEKGRYHFDTLDRSVDAIVKTGATPLMCICFKPPLLFPGINQDLVEPNDYVEWEKLITALVAHYRQRGSPVQYWEIANEPDIGEDGGCPYRFQPDNYVRYYRRTAAAILRADPDARVGGPALAGVRSAILPALLEACDSEKLPLHFVSWHAYTSDPLNIRKTIDYAKGLLQKHPSLKVETFLDEWNMDLMNPPLDPAFQPCFILESIWQMKEAGLDYSCYYHIRDWQASPEEFSGFMSPRGVQFMVRWWNRMPQFDGLFDYQNTIRPSYFAFKLLSRVAGERVQLTSSAAGIRGFAAIDHDLRLNNVLLWNFSTNHISLDLRVKGLPEKTRRRHLVLDARTGSNDENLRLRPDPSRMLNRSELEERVELEPFGIQAWSFE